MLALETSCRTGNPVLMEFRLVNVVLNSKSDNSLNSLSDIFSTAKALDTVMFLYRLVLLFRRCLSSSPMTWLCLLRYTRLLAWPHQTLDCSDSAWCSLNILHPVLILSTLISLRAGRHPAWVIDGKGEHFSRNTKNTSNKYLYCWPSIK